MVTREQIHQYIEESGKKKPDAVEKALRKRLEEEGISGTVTRGGQTFDVVDYIISDLSSYLG
jgi:hypothetical protein